MTRPALRNRSVKRMRTGFDATNLECARIIAADPNRYAGLPLEWASAVLRRRNDLPLIEPKENAA